MARTLLCTLALASLHMCSATVGKSTYAMSHPFAWKAWMEKYLPTAENIVQKNSTKTCNEWVKLCIDDGSTPFKCSGPQGNTQLHSVGAYERDSGTKSMEDLEELFTGAMGGMKKYDPWMELHVMFYTSDVDSYVSSFAKAGVPHFELTFSSSGKKYHSVIVQVDGSLRDGAGSMVVLEIAGTDSDGLAARRGLYHHPIARASASALARAEATQRRRRTVASASSSSSSPPSLTMMHISFPSSDVSRDRKYFEDVLGGSKVSLTTKNGTTTYDGKLFSDDTVELRYVQSAASTQGDFSVADWEAYTSALHKTCIPCPNDSNQGFDRLADNHIGGHGRSVSLDTIIKNQRAANLPYRVYAPPGGKGSQHFLYVYGPNGWGTQLTGQVSSKYTSGAAFYDMCTQGITGHCSKDL